ncbi:MAG: thymidine phosphorylase, partial [Lactobacillus sp.]|nr:thymidine phosphorylase [Lactobacillus sp.]
MFPQEIIRRKRDNHKLTKEEIDFFIKGVTSGEIKDSQIGALTMSIFLNGMSKEEVINLTLAMRDSGDVLKWKLNGPVIDKHSTGGVGDKVSLMLAPMLAACGGYVPMISGRGLGHTGGTLDKFDSIPGYQTIPTNELFKKVVKDIGCAIIGQTGNLAPADKKIYAIRDISGTVESIPLITASILSKKLSAGLDYLVMDLKFGNGAFMDNLPKAKALAKSIVGVANGANTPTEAIITDMNQVLGHSVGNAVEMSEAVDYLQNKNIDPRLHEVNMALCSSILVASKLCKNLTEAKSKLEKSLSSGKALEIFAKMISALGGPKDFTSKPEKYLPKSKIIKPLYSTKTGYVSSMHTRNIGLSIISLKGGRTFAEQKLDYAT